MKQFVINFMIGEMFLEEIMPDIYDAKSKASNTASKRTNQDAWNFETEIDCKVSGVCVCGV